MENREIIEQIANIIQDPSYSHPMLLAKVNKGIGRVATLVDLPDLKTSESVATDTSNPFIVLPITAGNAFHVGKVKALFHVASQGQGVQRNIVESWIKFLEKYPMLDETGDVIDVAVRGNRLYYQGVPASADTLDLHYYRKPVLCVINTNDEPDGIPEHLQEDLLVNFGCWDCFKEIEDDESGQTPNTNKYQNLFSMALAELKGFVGVPDARPDHYEYDAEDFI